MAMVMVVVMGNSMNLLRVHDAYLVRVLESIYCHLILACF